MNNNKELKLVCYHEDAWEERSAFIIGIKTEYESMDEFVSSALEYFSSYGEVSDIKEEYYQERTYSEVESRLTYNQWLQGRLEKMYRKASIPFQSLVNVTDIIPPE